MHLDETLLRDWQRDGYLVLPGFVAGADCAALVQHAHALAATHAASAASVFSTRCSRPSHAMRGWPLWPWVWAWPSRA